ncbi:hypothetical protein Slin14017_G126990 [Septoria linicola]|nr:hypothetical protein Slin14017_G126990 [Septoria linicola]
MRLGLYLFTVLALFWQSVFALPVANNQLAPILHNEGAHHAPRAVIHTKSRAATEHTRTKRGWGSLLKPAKKLWDKVTGKNKNAIKVPPKVQKAVKADMDKWRPFVEAQRKKNQGLAG